MPCDRGSLNSANRPFVSVSLKRLVLSSCDYAQCPIHPWYPSAQPLCKTIKKRNHKKQSATPSTYPSIWQYCNSRGSRPLQEATNAREMLKPRERGGDGVRRLPRRRRKNAKDAGDSMLATDASVVYKRHPSKHRPGVQRHP
jgi:hypothetical protein